MLYRIDFESFINHAIDHFDIDTLTNNFQYLIISSHVSCGRTFPNTVKSLELYPSFDIMKEINEYSIDKDRLDRQYHDQLNESIVAIKNLILMPLKANHNIVIIYDRCESYVIDSFARFTMSRLSVPVINLQELFITGHIDPIEYDRDDIHNKFVNIAREAYHEVRVSLESTSGGRMKLLNDIMDIDQKYNKLKELGVSKRNIKKSEIDDILIDLWVNGEEGD